MNLHVLPNGSFQVTADQGLTIRHVDSDPPLFDSTSDEALVVYPKNSPVQVVRDLRPGDSGRWVQRYHTLLPLRYDLYYIERGGNTFRYSRGLGIVVLLAGGLAAVPIVLWLLALGVMSAASRKELRP